MFFKCSRPQVFSAIEFFLAKFQKKVFTYAQKKNSIDVFLWILQTFSEQFF